MSTRTYTVRVHDDDRPNHPGKPWSAVLVDGTGQPTGDGSAGLGVTLVEAVVDALYRQGLDLA